MRWTLVRCEDCGNHYTARLIDGAFCLTTDSGDCPCGSDTFVELGESHPTALPSDGQTNPNDTV